MKPCILILGCLLLISISSYSHYSIYSPNIEGASQTIRNAGAEVTNYHKATGRWPEKLSDIPNYSNYFYHNEIVCYDNFIKTISLDLYINKSSFLYKISFGYIGSNIVYNHIHNHVNKGVDSFCMLTPNYRGGWE